MLDFHCKKSPPQRPTNYFESRVQRRLLLLVLMLGGIILLMGEAAKPKNWAWLWQLPMQAEAQRQAAVRQPDEEVDSRVPHQPKAELDPGVIRSDLPPPDGPDVKKVFFKGVQPQLLAKVSDGSPFRSAEHEAFFHLLKILAETDASELAAASSGRVSYVQLAKQSAEYRGELVSLGGLVHRVLHRDAPPNEHGIEGYFQVIIQSPDKLEPIVVYCLELPQGFPTGEQVMQQAELTGFFFKRWLYLAGDGMRSAPLLLAKTLQWTPPAPVAEEAEPPSTAARMLLMIGFALLITVVFIGYLIAGKPAGLPRRLSAEGRADSQGSVLGLSKLQDMELAPEAGAALRQLTEQSHAVRRTAEEPPNDSSTGDS